jgi:Immunoglobulin domain
MNEKSVRRSPDFFFSSSFACCSLVPLVLHLPPLAGIPECVGRNPAAPRINPFHMPHVMINAQVQISCVVEDGDPPLSIRWFRNGRPLHSASGAPVSPAPPRSHLSHLTHLSSLPPGLRVIDFNAYSSILTVDHVTLAHGGNYSCLAENAAGIAVHAVPPSFSNVLAIFKKLFE